MAGAVELFGRIEAAKQEHLSLSRGLATAHAEIAQLELQRSAIANECAATCAAIDAARRGALQAAHDAHTVETETAALAELLAKQQAALQHTERRLRQLQASLQKKKLQIRQLQTAVPSQQENAVVPPDGGLTRRQLEETEALVAALELELNRERQRSQELEARLREEEHSAGPREGERGKERENRLAALARDREEITEAGEQIIAQLHARLEALGEEEALLQGLSEFCVE